MAELLVGFISRVAPPGEPVPPRPTHPEAPPKAAAAAVTAAAEEDEDGGDVPVEVKRSFAACRLFSAMDPSGASIEFLQTKQTAVISGAVATFGPRSSGVVAHGCAVLDHWLEEDADAVVDVLCGGAGGDAGGGEDGGLLEVCLGGLLGVCGNAAARASFLKVVSCQDGSARARAKLGEALVAWRLLPRVVEQVTAPPAAAGSFGAAASGAAAAETAVEAADRSEAATELLAALLDKIDTCPSGSAGGSAGGGGDGFLGGGPAGFGARLAEPLVAGSSGTRGLVASLAAAAADASGDRPYAQRLAATRALAAVVKHLKPANPSASAAAPGAAAAVAAAGSGNAGAAASMAQAAATKAKAMMLRGNAVTTAAAAAAAAAAVAAEADPLCGVRPGCRAQVVGCLPLLVGVLAGDASGQAVLQVRNTCLYLFFFVSFDFVLSLSLSRRVEPPKVCHRKQTPPQPIPQRARPTS